MLLIFKLNEEVAVFTHMLVLSLGRSLTSAEGASILSKCSRGLLAVEKKQTTNETDGLDCISNFWGAHFYHVH